MALAIPRIHPTQHTQSSCLFDCTATFRNARGLVNITGLVGLLAAYAPALGGVPSPYQGEAATIDRLLVQGWHPTIPVKAQVLLTLSDGVTVKVFRVDDVLMDSDKNGDTLLTVTPWSAGAT